MLAHRIVETKYDVTHCYDELINIYTCTNYGYVLECVCDIHGAPIESGEQIECDSVWLPQSYRTKMHEYKQRPMQSKKCQQYGHTINRCRTEFSMCGKCSPIGHKSEVCVAVVAPTWVGLTEL